MHTTNNHTCTYAVYACIRPGFTVICILPDCLSIQDIQTVLPNNSTTCLLTRNSMDLRAPGRLKDICYGQQREIIFIVQNILVLCFYCTLGHLNSGVHRAFAAYSGIGYTAIGMAERQLLIALIILVFHILVNVMQV
jgi:hypothetical protein